LQAATQKGKEKGRQGEKIAIAKNLLSMGYKIGEIAKITGLSTSDINSL
jgi:predicted transposase/invertase (TIGR01784 family)